MTLSSSVDSHQKGKACPQLFLSTRQNWVVMNDDVVSEEPSANLLLLYLILFLGAFGKRNGQYCSINALCLTMWSLSRPENIFVLGHGSASFSRVEQAVRYGRIFVAGLLRTSVTSFSTLDYYSKNGFVIYNDSRQIPHYA